MSRYRIVARESEDEITYLSLRMVSRGTVRYGGRDGRGAADYGGGDGNDELCGASTEGEPVGPTVVSGHCGGWGCVCFLRGFMVDLYLKKQR